MIIPGRSAIAFTALCVSVVFGAVLPLSALSEGLYRSNAVGMTLEQIGAVSSERPPVDQVPYVLRISRETAPGDPTQRFERVLEGPDGPEAQSVIDIRNGRRIREREIQEDGYIERLYTGGGLVDRVVVHDSDGLREERRYRYVDSRLLEVRTEHRNPDESYRELYRYRTDGRLRSVTRLYESGLQRSSEYMFYGERLVEEWHFDGREDLFIRYNDDSRLVRVEVYRDGELYEEERLAWRAGGDRTGPVLEEQMRFDAEESTTETLRFDPEGRVIARRTDRDGETVSEQRMLYEDDLLVREELERSDGSSELQLFTYSDDGELVRSLRSRDGVPIVLREHSEDETTLETRYVDGEPALRIEFREGRRVREAVLEQGEVVRERVF